MPQIIKYANRAVNFIILAMILLPASFAVYALWDSRQIYNAAGSRRYEAFRPAAASSAKSFEELTAINGEVFAWLTVHGTNIDYPVTQAGDNMKYVNTNAEGNYSLSGSIFLDYRNSADFSDAASIIYGHHMTKRTMFGEIGGFADKKTFDTHTTGSLFFGGEDHGVEFFAFIHTSAYNSAILSPRTAPDGQYLENLLAAAMHTRDVGVSADDSIILLTTCSGASTNGRDILVGRITGVSYGAGGTAAYSWDTEVVPCDLPRAAVMVMIAAVIAVWVMRRRDTRG